MLTLVLATGSEIDIGVFLFSRPTGTHRKRGHFLAAD